jgi:hypothetical protein
LLGVPDEYFGLLRQITATYACGHFFPAQTAAGALGERVLNRLIIRVRRHFESTPEYKKIYQKASFDNWDQPVEILQRWGVIPDAVADAFRRLKPLRNDAIHYRDGYDFGGCPNAC